MAGGGGHGRAALLTLGLLSAFGPLSLDLYLPGLPQLGADLGASDAQAQLTLSASLAGLAAGQLIAGPLSDRVGRRRPLLTGLVLFAVTSVLCAVAPSISLLVCARFVQGLGGSAGLVLSRAVVRDRYADDEIARVFSVLMLINSLAPVLAPLLGGVLLQVMPWRGLFLVLGGVGVLIGALTAWSLPESLPPERRQRGGPRALATATRSVLSERLFVGGTLVLALASGALFTYIALSSFVLQKTYGLSPSAFSAVFAANSCGIALAGAASAAALRRGVSSLRLLGGALVIMTVVAAALYLVARGGVGLPGLLPLVFGVVGLVGVVVPNATAVALVRHADSAGTASALLGAVQYLAAAVAGPLASVQGVSAGAMVAAMTLCSGGAFIVWGTVLLPVRGRLAPAAQARSERPR